MLLGGRPSRLADVRFRLAWTVPVALVLQLIIFGQLGEGLDQVSIERLHVASYVLLLAFAAANFRLRVLVPVLLGLMANATAIIANHGLMPVSASAARADGLSPGVHENVFVGPSRLGFLGDVFALPSELPAGQRLLDWRHPDRDRDDHVRRPRLDPGGRGARHRAFATDRAAADAELPRARGRQARFARGRLDHAHRARRLDLLDDRLDRPGGAAAPGPARAARARRRDRGLRGRPAAQAAPARLDRARSRPRGRGRACRRGLRRALVGLHGAGRVRRAGRGLQCMRSLAPAQPPAERTACLRERGARDRQGRRDGTWRARLRPDRLGGRRRSRARRRPGDVPRRDLPLRPHPRAVPDGCGAAGRRSSPRARSGTCSGAAG